jgi:uncharacterized protein YjbJ (UPF0337 family)
LNQRRVAALARGAGNFERGLMNKDQIKGGTQKGVGTVKEALGKATNDPRLQAEGVADKAKGATKEAFGKAKDAAHKVTK